MCLLFRHILVKYPERGLVINGTVSKLYNHLYFTMATTFTLLSYMLILIGNSDTNIFHVVCLQENQKDLDIDTWNFYILAVSVGICILIFTWIIYFSITIYRKRKSTGAKVPIIFGRFQRNIVTLDQTIVFNSIVCCFGLCFPLSVTIPNVLELSTEQRKFCILMFHLAEHCLYILFPLYLVPVIRVKMSSTNSVKEKSKVNVFYIKTPSFIPRRDVTLLQGQPYPISRGKARMIFVKERKQL